jgi:hypothetical protein
MRWIECAAATACLLAVTTRSARAQTLEQPYEQDQRVWVTPVQPPTGYEAWIDIYNGCAAGATKLSTTALTVTPGSSPVPIGLSGPLTTGATICAVESYSGSPAMAATNASALVIARSAAQIATAPPGWDWGLVRAYFTFGALLSQQDSQFSHSDLFLSFHLDKTYLPLKNLDSTSKHSLMPGLNSFFEPRLTALPVTVQPCAATTTTSGSSGSSTPTSSSCSSANSTATTTSGTTAASTDTTTVFLNSQKSARLTFGVYAPVMLNRWAIASKDSSGKTQNQAYALFIGPLVKTGFDTSLNGLNQTQQQSSTPNTVQPVGNSNEFYKFYDYGFRLGHITLTGDKAKAPELMSYLDVTWGRFSNMASLLCPVASYTGGLTCAAPSSTTNSGTSTTTTTFVLPWSHDYRMNVEGLLEIPGLQGLSIGFSTNVGAWRAGPPKNRVVHIRPQDDLRFLFAYKFDITKMAAKLAGQ